MPQDVPPPVGPDPFTWKLETGIEWQVQLKSLDLEMVDGEDKPVPGEKYLVLMPDGSTSTGKLDKDGKAKVLLPGDVEAKVTFPEYDQTAWERHTGEGDGGGAATA